MQSIPQIAVFIAVFVFLIGTAIIAYHIVKFGKKAQLKTIKPYENVLLFLYRHWFVLFLQVIGFVIIGAFPIAAFFVLPDNDLFFPIATVFYIVWLYAL